MSIEFKESVFRYIFPACLFWSPLIFVLFHRDLLLRDDFLINISNNIGLFLILLLATGMVISALGGIVMRVIDQCKKPSWNEVESELSYWRAAAKEAEFTQKKIDRRWNFYVTNLNSSIALFLSLIVLFFQKLSLFVIIVMIVIFLLMIIFCKLARWGYNAMLELDKILK